MVSKVEKRNLLRILDSSYLRAAVGSMKRTPTDALPCCDSRAASAALAKITTESSGLGMNVSAGVNSTR
jgi:hypothetical protein